MLPIYSIQCSWIVHCKFLVLSILKYTRSLTTYFSQILMESTPIDFIFWHFSDSLGTSLDHLVIANICIQVMYLIYAKNILSEYKKVGALFYKCVIEFHIFNYFFVVPLVEISWRHCKQIVCFNVKYNFLLWSLVKGIPSQVNFFKTLNAIHK